VKNSTLETRTQRKTKRRRKVLVPCAVTFLARIEQTEESRRVGDEVRLEQIPVPRHAKYSVDPRPRVDQIVVERRRIDLPSQPVAESQRGHHLPRVLRVIRKLVLVIALGERNKTVCAVCLVQRC